MNAGLSPGVGLKNNQTSVAGWVEYSQNATLVFISAYSAYVFCGKITIPLSTHLYQQRYLFWLVAPKKISRLKLTNKLDFYAFLYSNNR